MKLVTAECIIHLHNHILFRIFFFAAIFIIKNRQFYSCNYSLHAVQFAARSTIVTTGIPSCLSFSRNNIDAKGHDHFKI